MLSINKLAALFIFALPLFIVGCSQPTTQLASSTVVEAMSVANTEGFKRATEPIEFSFPLDHGPHPEYTTEWWYYTGNLVNQDGDDFGYQLTFFRSALTPEMESRDSAFATNQIYMAHFAITDVAGNEHVSFERYARGDQEMAGAVGEPMYEVWLDGWQVRQVNDSEYRMVASVVKDDVPYEIDFTLTGDRLLLHGDQGLSQKGTERGNANYYYSLAQLETVGTITIDDRVHEITGQTWMDHEYGTSALGGDTVGWDWFSVMLSDDTGLMFAQLRNAAGERIYTLGGTLSYPDGRQEKLDNVELTVLDEWTSPRTQITYPAAWQVVFPEHDIELRIEPMIADQEMDVSFIYYEGAIEVTGTHGNEDVSGKGYVELTGYTGDSQYQR